MIIMLELRNITYYNKDGVTTKGWVIYDHKKKKYLTLEDKRVRDKIEDRSNERSPLKEESSRFGAIFDDKAFANNIINEQNTKEKKEAGEL